MHAYKKREKVLREVTLRRRRELDIVKEMKVREVVLKGENFEERKRPMYMQRQWRRVNVRVMW